MLWGDGRCGEVGDGGGGVGVGLWSCGVMGGGVGVV